jgi:hypothetical protein
MEKSNQSVLESSDFESPFVRRRGPDVIEIRLGWSSGTLVFRHRKVAIQWWGLFIPLWQKNISIDLVRQVTLRWECGDEDDDPDGYSVRLEGDRMKELEIFSSTDYPPARRVAKDLAKFISLPITDFTSGNKIVRDPDRLDESLRERTKRLREDLSFLPSRPWSMKTRIQETEDGLIAEIPEQGIACPIWIRLVSLLTLSGAAAYFFWDFLEHPRPDPDYRIYIVLALLLLILGLIWLLPGRKSSTIIIATPAHLRVEERTGEKSRGIAEIPADELEELILVHDEETGTKERPDQLPGKLPVHLSDESYGIEARGKNASVVFAEELPEDELRYLHALIKKILTSREARAPRAA